MQQTLAAKSTGTVVRESVEPLVGTVVVLSAASMPRDGREGLKAI